MCYNGSWEIGDVLPEAPKKTEPKKPEESPPRLPPPRVDDDAVEFTAPPRRPSHPMDGDDDTDIDGNPVDDDTDGYDDAEVDDFDIGSPPPPPPKRGSQQPSMGC
jgi:hypothetical protein